MHFIFRCIVSLTLLATSLAEAKPSSYDPLAVSEKEIVSKTFDVTDAKRDRVIPLRIYFPETTNPAPVVFFSHGLGGSRDNNPYLGNHWAKRGYVVVFVQHPGSDEAVWKDAPKAGRMAAMSTAASGENLVLRAQDIPAVIDALTRWNSESDHPLHARLDLKKIGMSGHSFGAVTTQTLAGQTLALGQVSYGEPRISAAIMMSPSPPRAGDPAKAFSPIKIPCLLMTGTEDGSPIGNTTAEDRLNVFPHLKKADAWQVVFDQATHMSFGERVQAGKTNEPTRYHRAILALSTAFWDAQLRGDIAALTWLQGPEARSVLVAADRWESKKSADQKVQD